MSAQQEFSRQVCETVVWGFPKGVQDNCTHRGEASAPVNLADPRPQLHSLVGRPRAEQLAVVVHAKNVALVAGEEAVIVEDNAIAVPVKPNSAPDHYHFVGAENVTATVMLLKTHDYDLEVYHYQ